jgi:putative phosphoribosyl transferase
MANPARRAAQSPGPPAFTDRAEAGVLLGRVLKDLQFDHPERQRVFAIPRGGVAVGVGVARLLRVPLDVIVVRKIGHPEAPELGLGAVAEGGEPVFAEELLSQTGLKREDLADVVARERAELARRVSVYCPERAAVPASGGEPDLAGQLVIVVDDGLATGGTARAALRAVRARGAARTVLAVPVAAAESVAAMENETGEVVTLITPRRFRSVGEWYADFGQLTDRDVLALLSPGGTTPLPRDRIRQRWRGASDDGAPRSARPR